MKAPLFLLGGFDQLQSLGATTGKLDFHAPGGELVLQDSEIGVVIIDDQGSQPLKQGAADAARGAAICMASAGGGYVISVAEIERSISPFPCVACSARPVA